MLHELDADLNFTTTDGDTPLSLACRRARSAAVRALCISGAERNFRLRVPGNAQFQAVTADELLQISAPENADVVQFLRRTSAFVNPLQYSAEINVEEVRSWLRSEKLRDFPEVALVNRDSNGCRLVESALVWSGGAADLFPASCRRRAREIVYISWQEKQLSSAVVATNVLPFVIDRYD